MRRKKTLVVDGGAAEISHLQEQVEALRNALQQIKNIKPAPVGDGAFVTGPQAHIDAAKRIATDALRALANLEQEG